jgi:hypothetical protein
MAVPIRVCQQLLQPPRYHRHSESSNTPPYTMEMALRHLPMTTASPPRATTNAPAPVPAAATAAFRILAAVSFCHMLNDMVQSLLPSIYPILKSSFRLNSDR